jgi:hypothetical protein
VSLVFHFNSHVSFLSLALHPKVFHFNSWYLSHRLCRDYLTRRDCRPFSGHQELKGYSTLSLPQASPVYFAESLPFSLESHVLLMAGGNLGG